MSNIPPVQGADATPPPQSKDAVNHQGRGGAWGAGHMIGIANGQKRGIEAGTYYAKVLRELQEILSKLNAALLEMMTDPAKGIAELEGALKDLHALGQVKASTWGGKFGLAMGKQIHQRIQNMISAISKGLGSVGGGNGDYGRFLVEYLKNPNQSFYKGASYWFHQIAAYCTKQVAEGKEPFASMLGVVGNQMDSLAEFTALLQAQLTRLKNNGITALQTAGKFVSMFWKVIIQMISGIQQG